MNVVAHLDEMPAGMVGAYAPNETGSVELISMWVAPCARGLRVGDALIDAVAQWAMQRAASRIVLAVREQNRHAIALYARNGFTRCGEPPIIDSDCACELRMARELPTSAR